LNKTEPAKYVEYVLGLAEGGIGRLGPQEINVKSDAALLRSYKNTRILANPQRFVEKFCLT